MSAAPLLERWRAEAKILRARGAGGQAEAVESCAAELEAFEREHRLEALTMEQAATESGYTYSALEKMVRMGHLENVGAKGKPRVRRGDLPRKAVAPKRLTAGGPELAADVLRDRAAGGRVAGRAVHPLA